VNRYRKPDHPLVIPSDEAIERQLAERDMRVTKA
jgi:hypothetical protein